MQAERYFPLSEKLTRAASKAPVARETIKTVFDYLVLSSKGQEVPIPRTSLAMFNGIASTFPESTKEGRREKALKLSRFSPILIALNEAADIGISADLRLKKGNIPSWKTKALVMLKNRAFQDLNERKQTFLEQYPEEKEAIENFIKDFLFLSEHRGDFSPNNYPDFLELDSGIFVAICLHITVPDIAKEAGIDLSKDVNNLDDLKEKYSLFLLKDSDKRKFSPLEEKIRSLHALEMILKIRDDVNDKRDSNIDAILGLPNFWRYAEKEETAKPYLALKDLHNAYMKIAKKEFPKPVPTLTSLLCSITSRIKSKKSSRSTKIIEDPENFHHFFGKRKQTTTLRHEMNASSVLSELFR